MVFGGAWCGGPGCGRTGRYPGPGEYGCPDRPAPERAGGRFAYESAWPACGTAVSRFGGVGGGDPGPGPGAYEVPGSLPPAGRLPRSQEEWLAYAAFYPEARFRM